MNLPQGSHPQAENATEAWGAVRPFSVSELLFDPNNPRLPAFSTPPSQEVLLAWMVKKYAIGELMDSLSINGYFEEEPLVGIPASTNRGKVTIVEGNRRLAALRLLLDPAQARALKDPETERALRIRVPPTPARTLQRLATVPVRLYTQRSDIMAYLGYRHITGIKPWDSYSKARYVAQLVDQGTTLQDIQRQIGDRHETAPRLYRAYLVWGQAGDKDLLDRNGSTPPFSYLFTALTFRPVLIFLGLAAHGIPQPVDNRHLQELEELTTYLYGNKKAGRDPAIKESRDIKDLSQALSSQAGRQRLAAGSKVQEAVDAMPAEESRLERLLRQAIDRLAQAMELAPHHRTNESLRKLAGSCVESARNLFRTFTRT